MNASIRVEKVMTPGLVLVSYDGDVAMWALAKTRKDTVDAATGAPVPKGSEAFRPVGNQQYRSQRISRAGMLALVEAFGVADEGGSE